MSVIELKNKYSFTVVKEKLGEFPRDDVSELFEEGNKVVSFTARTWQEAKDYLEVFHKGFDSYLHGNLQISMTDLSVEVNGASYPIRVEDVNFEAKEQDE